MRKLEIQKILDRYQVHVKTFQETKLTVEQPFKVAGYIVNRWDRKQYNGGAAILVKRGREYKQRPTSEDPTFL